MNSELVFSKYYWEAVDAPPKPEFPDGLQRYAHSPKASKWRWSKDARCFIIQPYPAAPPTHFCLGDRYVFCTYGIDSFGLIWRGFKPNSTAIVEFGNDLTAAMSWVQSAHYRNLEAKLWSQPE